jgi:hypothetical protein
MCSLELQFHRNIVSPHQVYKIETYVNEGRSISRSAKIFPWVFVVKPVGVYQNCNIFFSNILGGSLPLATNMKFI